ncbi:MAG: oligopeptide transport system substrate-binding protein [Verrucomicrobiales bacterium]|jgi:oligopeptide transport system substrate-binding protein
MIFAQDGFKFRAMTPIQFLQFSIRPVCGLWLAAVLVFGLAACSDQTPVDKATADGIMIMGNSAEPKGLDPHIVSGVLENNIIRSLFEGLVIEHPSKDGEYLPGVADKVEKNEDASEWTFHLREEARWSDGYPLTSEDFMFSFERILTPNLASDYSFMLYYIEGAEAFHKGETTDFSTVGVTAPDAHTLKVKLRGPLPFLPEITKHYTWFPVPKHIVLKYGAIGEPFTGWTDEGNLVGNGAFQLKSWRINDHIEVERNPEYWDAENVGINGIRFLPIGNSYTETRMFFSEQMHLTYRVPAEMIQIAADEYSDELRVEPWIGTYFIRCNVDDPAFKDKRVRQAFSLAIDQQSIIDNVTLGKQPPAKGMVPPFGDYPASDKVRFDPEKARQLLAEAGFPGGKGLPDIEFLTTDQDSAKALSEALQAMWLEHLGVTIRIKQMEWTSYLATMFSQDYGLAAGGWIGDYLDPLTFLDMWIEDGGNNRTGWSSEVFEGLLDEAQQEGDQAKRYVLLKQAEELFLEERPVLPIYWYTRNYLLHPDLKGWNPLILDNHPYKFLKLEADKN